MLSSATHSLMIVGVESFLDNERGGVWNETRSISMEFVSSENIQVIISHML